MNSLNCVVVSSATMLKSLFFIFLFDSAIKEGYGKHLVKDSAPGRLGIVGGHDVDIKQFPYQAGLLILVPGTTDKWGLRCGGVIVAENYVLTAARCVDGVRSKLRVLVGSSSPTEGGKVYDVLAIVLHPEFDSDIGDYDTALLKTNKIDLNGETTKAVQLPEPGSKLKPGDIVVTTGWGFNATNGTGIQKVLQAGSLPVVSFEKCAKIYKDYATITDRMFCVGLDKSGISPCRGDVGDPAVAESNSVLYGLTLYTIASNCSASEIPAIYVDIAAMRDWIKEVIGA